MTSRFCVVLSRAGRLLPYRIASARLDIHKPKRGMLESRYALQVCAPLSMLVSLHILSRGLLVGQCVPWYLLRVVGECGLLKRMAKFLKLSPKRHYLANSSSSARLSKAKCVVGWRCRHICNLCEALLSYFNLASEILNRGSLNPGLNKDSTRNVSNLTTATSIVFLSPDQTSVPANFESSPEGGAARPH